MVKLIISIIINHSKFMFIINYPYLIKAVELLIINFIKNFIMIICEIDLKNFLSI